MRLSAPNGCRNLVALAVACSWVLSCGPDLEREISWGPFESEDQNGLITRVSTAWRAGKLRIKFEVTSLSEEAMSEVLAESAGPNVELRLYDEDEFELCSFTVRLSAPIRSDESTIKMTGATDECPSHEYRQARKLGFSERPTLRLRQKR